MGAQKNKKAELGLGGWCETRGGVRFLFSLAYSLNGPPTEGPHGVGRHVVFGFQTLG